MYIKKLELLNFQVIEEFSGDFEGNVYFITGENELGKSTLLKAISVLLTGDRDEVLKIGAKKGFAKAIVGDDGLNYEVELRMTEANPRGTLTIKSPDGMQSDNKSMLQSIFGYQDFDAVEFSQWSETAEGRRKQVEIVKSLLPVEVQKRIAEIDVETKRIKEGDRKEANATLKMYQTIISNTEKEIAPGEMAKYAKPIEIGALMEEQKVEAQLIEKAKTVKASRDQRIEQLAAIPQRLVDVETSYQAKQTSIQIAATENLEEYKRAIAAAKTRFKQQTTALEQLAVEAAEICEKSKKLIVDEKADLETRKANADKWLAEYEKSNPEGNDTETRVKNAEDHNRKHAKVAEYNENVKLKKAVEKKIDDLETQTDKLATERETLIKNSKLPIEGLNFTDDGLELNGVSFAPGKVSDSQIMEVAAKLIICKNPKVKVFRVGRGESLGKNRLQSLIQLAKKSGYQGFIEQVIRDQNEMRVEEYTEK
jgi:DNA repair exonuclease SbcCD ATPase subunit